MLLFFLYFFMGHLAGDFLLQTSRLVRWKHESLWGITIHVLLVLLGTVVVFIPYLDSVLIWIAIILNAIVHWGIDFLKVSYEKSMKPKNLIPGFYLDQIAHIATFSIIVCWLYQFPVFPHFFTHAWWFEYYTNVNLFLYVTGVLFFSYSFDIILFMHRLKSGDTNPYERGYFAMIVRTFLFAVLFTLCWFVINFGLKTW